MELRRPTPLWTRLLLLAGSLGVTAVLGVGAWALIGDVTDLRHSLWLARQRLFGPEPVGIWESDPRLGWRHVPGSEGRQREVPDYDVRYHIDAEGHRRTPGAPGIGAPALLFLGGSVTFGHGVEDDETYPALLQRRWPGVRVVNAATNAWGTTQALLTLEDALAENRPWIGFVYGFIGHHLRRNHRSLEWLQDLDASRGRRNPYYELVDGHLEFQGLADPADGIPQSAEQTEREVRVTLALLREMRRLSREHALPFIVLHLPDGSTDEFGDVLAEALGKESFVDLRPRMEYGEMHFRHDYHYTPEGHRRVASAVAPLLARRIPALAAPAANVLLITLDTVRADRLGCYGYGRPTSPHLDRLAEDAFVFERVIAQSAVTPVSHASLLTGLNPYRHGLRSLHGGEAYVLGGEQRTLAERLDDEGYATAAFVSAFPASRRYGLHQGFEVWDQDFENNDESDLIDEDGVVNTEGAQRRADATTERALAWLRSRDAERPFFLWTHYFDVHDPVLLPPDEVLGRFPAASESTPDIRRSVYDAELAFIDTQVGRLLAELDRQGTRERTIVAVVSDHGEGLGDHGWWGHGILYQEQLRVPLLLSVPGRIGTRVTPLVRTVDLLPTLLELLGLEPVPGSELDGRSFVGLLDGAGDAPRVAYSESVNDLTAYYNSPLQDQSLYAVNDGRWKLILHREEGRDVSFELFDLAADPRESHDLAREHPAEAARLLESLRRLEPFAGRRDVTPIDEETRRKLRSLGYVD